MPSRFCPQSQTKSKELSFLLSSRWTRTLSVIYLPHQCKHCRLFEMTVYQLQKIVLLLLALSVPPTSREKNHTLALCRLHTKKSLAGEKRSHQEREKLLDDLRVLTCSGKVSFLPWNPHSTDRSNSFSFSGPRRFSHLFHTPTTLYSIRANNINHICLTDTLLLKYRWYD